MKAVVLKKSKSFDVYNCRSLGIQSWGERNDYPQSVREILNSSSTGKPCANTYAKFINGKGFSDVNFAEMIINHLGQTNDTLLSLIKDDYANFGAFAIHCNYNLLGEIVEKQYIPVETCRFEALDTETYQFNRIALHSDWGQRYTNLKRFKKDDIIFINLFNPENVKNEITEAGGIENYKGQIFFYSNQGNKTYPLPIFDNVLTDMNTEEGCSNVANRNARNNFQTAGMLIDIVNPDNSIEQDETKKEYQLEKQQQTTIDNLKQFQGDEVAGKLLYISVASKEEIPTFTPFNGENYDKEYTVTNDICRLKIGGAFVQPPILRAENISTGFSVDAMRNAYDYYNSTTNTERMVIERAFKEIDKYWAFQQSENFEIAPLNYDVQITIAEKIGKENIQWVFDIVRDINTPKADKKLLIKGLFNLTNEEINSLINDDSNI